MNLTQTHLTKSILSMLFYVDHALFYVRRIHWTK